jgi:hypothetical protein
MDTEQQNTHEQQHQYDQLQDGRHPAPDRPNMINGRHDSFKKLHTPNFDARKTSDETSTGPESVAIRNVTTVTPTVFIEGATNNCENHQMADVVSNAGGGEDDVPQMSNERLSDTVPVNSTSNNGLRFLTPDPPIQPPTSTGNLHRNNRKASIAVGASTLDLPTNVGRRIVIHPQPNESERTFNFDNIQIQPFKSHTSGGLYWILLPFIFVLEFLHSHYVKYVQYKRKGQFIDNTVRTARYGFVDFLPKQLLAQFSKMGNLYFLLITVLQTVPGWSPTGQFTTIFPLSIFVGFAMLKEAVEDSRRHKQDKVENFMICKRMWTKENDMAGTSNANGGKERVENNLPPQERPVFQEVHWKDLMVCVWTGYCLEFANVLTIFAPTFLVSRSGTWCILSKEM